MTVYFISDLHLTPKRPRTNGLFYDFLESIKPGAQALYILGDLFEFWIGDDAAEVTGQSDVLAALRGTTNSGIPVYFMHGNRDFLVGEDFASATGCQLLNDPTSIQFGEVKVLLMHGDSMCTDDTDHQRFRILVNDPEWQREFLNYPIEKRIDLALRARSQSALHTSMTSMEIMDVNLRAVEKEIICHDADFLVHGHTHRPGIHPVQIDQVEKTRIVLGDWYEQSSVLRFTQGKFCLRANDLDYPSVS